MIESIFISKWNKYFKEIIILNLKGNAPSLDISQWNHLSHLQLKLLRAL